MSAADSSNLKSDYSKCGYRQAEICISNSNILNVTPIKLPSPPHQRQINSNLS